jgi:hypothetical protein
LSPAELSAKVDIRLVKASYDIHKNVSSTVSLAT